MRLPKIKKKVNAFLVGEEGKISKKSLLKVGAVLSTIALGSALSAEKTKAELCSGSGSATHASHSSHGSHSSHSSHGSHASW
jgi:hypothetical protein